MKIIFLRSKDKKLESERLFSSPNLAIASFYVVDGNVQYSGLYFATNAILNIKILTLVTPRSQKAQLILLLYIEREREFLY